MKAEVKNYIYQGILFWLCCSVSLCMVFLLYMLGSGDTSFMDFVGWTYFFFSCLCHAGLIMLLPLLIFFVPLTFMKVRYGFSFFILSLLYTLIILIFVINRYVFQIYHFHINGFIVDMLFSEGAGEIFVFSFALYIKAIIILLCVILLVFALFKLSSFLNTKINKQKRLFSVIFSLFFVALFISQGFHIYASAKIKTSVLESTSFIPYYFPLSMNSVLDKLGIIDKKNITNIRFRDGASNLNYPIKKIESNKIEKPLNIIIIAIDSWNFRTLSQECMPNTHKFKDKSAFFSHHLSSSNGTRGGLFGLFTGLSSYYWNSFEYSSLRPVFFEELKKNNYTIQLYPSATLKYPPFDRVLFKDLKGVNTSTHGNTPYERDCNITSNFIKDLPNYAEQKQPFFAFLFYDLPHAISLPKEKNSRFLPAWAYADYSKLNNNINPLPFYNLYRNCVYQTDSLIGMVMENMEKYNLLDNTLIIITGDHGQEFNENHKNYWGHSGNYSKYQIQVPLIVYYPNIENKTYTHITTHYDVVPTVMNIFLGVKNKPNEYSMGTFLYDTNRKDWHIVGNDINYAFITADGYIIEKSGAGYIKVYDQNLNLQKDYPLPAKQINKSLQNLNRFFK